MRKEISMSNSKGNDDRIIYSPWLERLSNCFYSDELSVCSTGLSMWFKYPKSTKRVRFYLIIVPTHLTYKIQMIKASVWETNITINDEIVLLHSSFAYWLHEQWLSSMGEHKQSVYIGLEYK